MKNHNQIAYHTTLFFFNYEAFIAVKSLIFVPLFSFNVPKLVAMMALNISSVSPMRIIKELSWTQASPSSSTTSSSSREPWCFLLIFCSSSFTLNLKQCCLSCLCLIHLGFMYLQWAAEFFHRDGCNIFCLYDFHHDVVVSRWKTSQNLGYHRLVSDSSPQALSRFAMAQTLEMKLWTPSVLFICMVSKSCLRFWDLMVVNFVHPWNSVWRISQASLVVEASSMLVNISSSIACWIRHRADASLFLSSLCCNTLDELGMPFFRYIPCVLRAKNGLHLDTPSFIATSTFLQYGKRCWKHTILTCNHMRGVRKNRKRSRGLMSLIPLC